MTEDAHAPDRNGRTTKAITDGPRAVVRGVGQLAATVRNVAEVMRFGGLHTDDESSPYAVLAEQVNYRLRRYFPDQVPAAGRPVLLIPPLMMSAEIWDVSEGTSAVAALHREGIDPWLIDFGDPAHEPGGVDRTLTDHVLAVSDAVDRVYALTGRDVVLAGYSQGGMFAYQTAAFRRGEHIDSLVTFGSPADTTAPLPIPIPADRVASLADALVRTGLLRRVTLPSWAVRVGFHLLSPAKTVQGRVKFLLALNDRQELLPRERQRRFLETEGWTAYSGPAIAELLEQFVAHNRMLEGGFVIDERLVTLADLELPVLSVVGSTDTIGHPDSVRAIRRAAPRADVYELMLHAGHFGLVVGSTASRQTWPAVAAWVHWRDGDGELPADVVPAQEVEPGLTVPDRATAALTWATGLGLDVSRLALNTARHAARTATSVVSQAPTLLPRLARLGQLHSSTRISLGLMLDEQAAKNPEEVCFLFGDRAYRQAEVKYRVDSVVRGLIGCGVRHGDRVGVLMDTRPSAFTVVAALSRLGATAVLLRPDGQLTVEAELGRISWLICDPEHRDAVDELPGIRCAVLGGGAGARELRPDVIDLEQVDPDEVPVPAWYRPNPQRADDGAFVLFIGEAEATKMISVTNRRWAASALGTASAAALRPGDTVYSVAPHYHSSAMLMSVGGAVAGGARFAMASSNEPETFWAEVRRYGATHVSYTWTSLRDVALGPPNLNEQHHPIRMFLGSGMPPNLWRRVTERFPTSRVLEFYASAKGGAILANLTGNPIGSMGRPLPGTPEVRIARFDLEHSQIVTGPDGLAREAEPGEVGVLLARVNPDHAANAPLRGLFDPDDAWQNTDDLFQRDEQDQFWLVDSAAGVIRTANGVVLGGPARRALESIPAVDLGVAYGVPDGDHDVLVVGLTVRANTALTAADLDQACARLAGRDRPSYVHTVSSLPLTTWSRPLWRELQEQGVPDTGMSLEVWRLDEDRGHYIRQPAPTNRRGAGARR